MVGQTLELVVSPLYPKAAQVAMTQRELEWARATLEKYKAEQLSTLRVAESAVDTAEQAEMEKKRTGGGAVRFLLAPRSKPPDVSSVWFF